MKIIEKDILTVEAGIICHQVNCQSKMNSGLAKSIREKWPVVYEKYISFHQDKPDFFRLGKFQYVVIEGDVINFGPKLAVANIYGQLNFGYDKLRYTDYGALNEAFSKIKYSHTEYVWNPPIYFPFNFGCDRGGGDWKIVSKMIDYYFPNAIICTL